MFCSQCGKKNEDSFKFCCFCGAKLEKNIAITEENIKNEEVELQKSDVLSASECQENKKQQSDDHLNNSNCDEKNTNDVVQDDGVELMVQWMVGMALFIICLLMLIESMSKK